MTGSVGRALVALAAVLAFVGAAGAIVRIGAHEAREQEVHVDGTLRERAAADGSTPRSARLLEMELVASDLAVFELCAEDGLPVDGWAGAAELIVWETGGENLLVRASLDAATLGEARRSGRGACLTAGRGVVPWSGTYAFDAVYRDQDRLRDLADVPLRAHGIVRWPLESLDALFVLLAFLGGVVFVGLLLSGRAPTFRPSDAALTRGGAALRLSGGILLALVIAEALSFWAAKQDLGAAGTLFRGLLFAAAEVALALLLVAPGLSRLETLGLTRPRISVGKGLVALAVTAAALSVVANLATRLVPSTGTAPIETFVSEPSGVLSFAALAAIAPLAEELFFRGFVYGTALRFGRAAAFIAAAALFGLAHAPQVWGSWGGLCAVVTAGVGLTLLRAWSGSIAVPLAAHLLYNAALAYGGLR